MATIEIVKASGKSYCRGHCKQCIAAYPNKIPKDSKALRIAISSASGGAISYFCEMCMRSILEDAKNALANC